MAITRMSAGDYRLLIDNRHAKAFTHETYGSMHGSIGQPKS